MIRHLLGSKLGLFGLGVGAAVLLRSDTAKRGARTLARELIKGGLQARAAAERLYDEVREELEDLSAEARAELDDEQEAPPAEDEP